jgi:hypothetical protein
MGEDFWSDRLQRTQSPNAAPAHRQSSARFTTNLTSAQPWLKLF